MKFPRNAKILRSHFDVAPFAAVLFILVIFLMLGALIPTAGIPLRVPEAGDLPGREGPTVAMAVDANTNYYYGNQIVSERVLATDFRAATNEAHGPVPLIVHADKTVSYDTIVHLSLLARRCGITNLWLATLPAVDEAPTKP
jgi:biopolymer transport protein ExbD